ncbi:ATP-binding cassette transporter snq2, partial [Coemansia sp. RSA 2706]
SEIPAACSGRLVSYKQKALAMYHPGLLAPVQTVLDLPYMVVSITLFSVILYFAAGLERSAGHFFAFVLFLLAACLCLTALFRLIGNASPSLDVAHTASGVILLLSIITNGYLVPPAQMGWQLRWFYWALNSLHYGYNTLMSLEFRNLRLACTGASLVPSGAGFDDVAHQVCTLQGARPGAATVLGRDYLLAGYGIDVGDMWWEFVVVLAYFVVFVAAMALCMEFLEFGNTGYTTLVHKRHKPAVEQHSDDEEERDYVRSFAAPSDAQLLAGTTFTWRDFNYTVPVKGGHRQLLNDVAGFVRPGQMTALMGASGAGKTTLLDALSQ